ncbi:MAG: hypothetical protein GQ531_09465 [Sulfurovum sp.]|nr:hypothetical protein [Sulfurovum sp.]
MLWEIEHKNLAKPSYLFGTYHSRDKEVNDLPLKVTQVLESTQTLYSETTMTKKSYEMIQNFMQASHLLPLRKRLSSSTFKRLQQHIKKAKIPLSTHTLSIFKTWAIALLLVNYTESKKNPHVLFMDERLVKSANDISMPSLGLETPKEQLVYFDILSPGEQELLLIDSMNQTENEQYTQALKKWYIKGELVGFSELQNTFKDKDPKIQALDEKLFASLLTERNSRFLQRIHLILQKNPQQNYFFAVGAGHLAEENGLIEELRKKGYRIDKVD